MRYTFNFIQILILIALVLSYSQSYDLNNNLRWTSVNVSTPKPQGDAHLITKNSKAILIDGGEYNQGKNNLIPYLKKHNIDTLDEVIITHPHFDHYGGIIAILEDKALKIKKLYMNMPTEEQMKKEYWGGKYKDLLNIRKLANERDTPIEQIKQGDIFKFDKNSYIKVLYIYDLNSTPIQNITINDMSAITMIYDYKHKYLLTGDLDKNIGKYLATNATNIKADILKVPHHGVTTLPPNSFFDKVNSKFYIITAPDYFWLDPKWKRSDRIKKYVKTHNIKTYINGIDGDITVISNKNGFNFETNPPEKITLNFSIKILSRKGDSSILQIFYSTNNKYNEKDSKKYTIDKSSINKLLHYSISIYGKPIKHIRVDPLNTEGKAIITNAYIQYKGKKIAIELSKISKKDIHTSILNSHFLFFIIPFYQINKITLR